jgi:hypothetical protein
LIFELICQRTAGQSDLLLVFDEPFAGVTDDFVPFIVQRLNELRQRHNILLVTNDHVETLKNMADNTIVVSATDRSVVQINGLNRVNREKAILALSVGNDFAYNASWDDLRFFLDVEVINNGGLIGVAAFTVFAFSFFLATFWDSDSDAAATVMVASLIIAYFCESLSFDFARLAHSHARRSQSLASLFLEHEQCTQEHPNFALDCCCLPYSMGHYSCRH